jgi:hypothetical protein
MGDLFGSPVLTIEQQSSQLEYRITDANGQVVGAATQVAGPKPRKGLLAMLGSGLGRARLVLRVSGVDRAPPFYVDYEPGAPPAVVAHDGTVIGRMQHDLLGEAQEVAGGGVAAGVVRTFTSGPVMKHRLVDAADRPLGGLTWVLRYTGTPDNPRWTPEACAYTDAHGQPIAHLDVREATFKDRYDLQLRYQLTEPLRTMVIASPLAYDLMMS